MEPQRMERERASGVSSFVTDRPVAVLMIIVAIAVFGFVSLGKLPVDLLPEISYPTFTVRTTYKGAAPADVEDRISVRVQEALSTLQWSLVRSTFDLARGNFRRRARIRLGHNDDLRGAGGPRQARQRVPTAGRRAAADPALRPQPRSRSCASACARRPSGATDPAVRNLIACAGWQNNASSANSNHRRRRGGPSARRARRGDPVRVDPFKMAAQGLDPALAARLGQENINASGGLIREGSTEYLVRTLNEFKTVQEIAELALERRGNGHDPRARRGTRSSAPIAEREVITASKAAKRWRSPSTARRAPTSSKLAESVQEASSARRATEKAAAEAGGPSGPMVEREKT
jgi:HAE1 family hydrophobic/amphiphilic exporter-1